MLKKLSLSLILALLLAGLASSASAAGPFGGRPPSPEKMFEKIAQELGLTQAQKDKYLATAKKVETDTDALRTKNKELFTKIEQEMVKDNPDSKAIHNYMQQISQNRTEIQFKRMEQMLQLRKELTPEQKAKFEQMTQKKKERAKEMFNKKKGKGHAGKMI